MSYDLLFTDEEVVPSLSKGEMHISIYVPDTYMYFWFWRSTGWKQTKNQKPILKTVVPIFQFKC